MKTSEHTDKLAEALAAAQGEFPSVERTRTVSVQMKTGGSYTFDYSPLDAIMDAVKPAMAKYKLAVCQPVEFTDGKVTVTTRLSHADQWYESNLAFPLGEARVQDLGSLITYLRRYALSPMLGIVSDMDDDGAAASGDSATVAPKAATPPCPKCGTSANVIKGKAEYGGGWLCWNKPEKGKHGCGEKWQDATAAPAPHNDPPGPECITREQGKELSRLIQEAGLTAAEFFAEYQIKRLGELPAVHFLDASMRLSRYIAENKKAG